MKKVKISFLALGLLLAGAPASQAAFVKAPVAISATAKNPTATDGTPATALEPLLGENDNAVTLSEAGAPTSIEKTRLSARQQRRLTLKAIWAGLKQGFRRAPGGGGKSQLIAALLCFFLGSLGIHRFYLGYTLIGILQLLAFILVPILAGAAIFATAVTTGSVGAAVIVGYLLIAGLFAWILVDFIRILTGSLQPKNGSYDRTL